MAHAQKFVDRFGAKASKASQAASRQKKIDSLKAIHGALQEELDLATATSTASFKLRLKEPSGKLVLTLKDLSIGYEKPLQDKISLNLRRGERLAILGG